STVLLTKPFDRDRLAQVLTLVSASGKALPETFRVLIVDDSAAARRYIREVLAGLGLRNCTEALNGAEAGALLETGAFDLVVTDYNMPHLDGRGLLEFIRRQSATPQVPVLMVTTETDPAKLDPVRRLGVLAICDKSFKPEVVRVLLDRLGQRTT